MDLFGGYGHAEPRRDLLEPGGGETGVAAGGSHALYTAPPLFYEAQGMEDAPEHSVAELGDAAFEVVDRDPKRQEPGIFDFEAVVEDRDPYGRPALRVVRMNNRVDDRFANGDWRQVPTFVSVNPPDLSAVQGVLFDERDGVADGSDEGPPKLRLIKDLGLVSAGKTSRLNPGIGEVSLSFPAKNEHAAHRWHLPALMGGE